MALNERFRELADRVIVKYPASEQWVFTDEELEKFFELIVKDCAKTLTENQDPSWQQNYLAGWQAAAEFLNKHIFKE